MKRVKTRNDKKETENFVSEKLRVNQKEMARPFKKISNFVFERKKKNHNNVLMEVYSVYSVEASVKEKKR